MSGRRNVPLFEIAHIGHAELFTPKPQETVQFFERVLGMQAVARAADSVYLRGFGDYQCSSLVVTGSSRPGLGHLGLRTWGPDELARCAAAIDRSGLGVGWIDGDFGHGPAYRFNDPDGHLMEIYWEIEPYVPPPDLRPALKNQPQRYVPRGAAVRRLDHVNLLAADVAACREFAHETLGYRVHERIVLDDGTEAGAWLSQTIAAHELTYVLDARGANGRLHHLAFWVDTREEVLRAADTFIEHGVPIEAAPSKHAIAQSFFLYAFEPGGNRIEVTTTGFFVYNPEPETVVWTQSERARGQAWGVKTIESFHTYGTPPVEPVGTDPPGREPAPRHPELVPACGRLGPGDSRQQGR